MIKYIAFDLDGTLLDDKKTISSETIIRIKRMVKNGYRIILISGIHKYEMEKYIIDLCLKQYKGNYIVSCDGQYIHTPEGNLLMSGDFLTEKDVLILAKMFQGSIIKFFTTDKQYYVKERTEVINSIYNFIYKYILSKPKIIVSTDQLRKPTIGSIEKVNISLLRRNLNKYFVQHYNYHFCEEDKLDVKHSHVSKWHALNKIFLFENLKNSEIAYFGDSENDLLCFKNLKYTFAMGNAINLIKQNAAYVVGSNNKYGILEGLDIVEELNGNL